MEQLTGSKLGKEYVKAVHCHPAYFTFMQSTSCKMLGWVYHNLESRLLGEIWISSYLQMMPPLMEESEAELKNLLMRVKICTCVFSVMSESATPHGLQPANLLCPWSFPDKNAEVGSHFFLQGIFPTQGLNPCLLHWQANSLSLCHLRMKEESEKAGLKLNIKKT